MPWIDEFYTIPILEEPGLIRDVASENIPKALVRHGIRDGKVGLDLVSKLLIDALCESCPRVLWVDGDAAMQASRRIKTL